MITWPGANVAQRTICLTSTMVHWQTFTMNGFKWEMVVCQIPLSLPAEVEVKSKCISKMHIPPYGAIKRPQFFAWGHPQNFKRPLWRLAMPRAKFYVDRSSPGWENRNWTKTQTVNLASHQCSIWRDKNSSSALTLLVGWQERHPACKTKWWDTGAVICLEWGTDDLHMVQLMPLPFHYLLFR